MSEETQKPAREIGWQATAINESFAKTGIKFTKSNADTLKAFGRDVVFDDDGRPHVNFDSEILPLEDGLTRWAFDSADGVADRRTLPREGAGGGRVGTMSKSGLTLAEKLEFIRVRGGAAYEALPLKSAGTFEVKTKQDFYKLPRAEKVRLTGKDPHFFSKLPDAPSDQPKGGYVNHAALAKHRATRPG